MYKEKQEAKRFVKKYDIEQIVTCFWDKDNPSKAAMNNDGGKGWGKIRTGIALAIAGAVLVSPCFLLFCGICFSAFVGKVCDTVCCCLRRNESKPRSAMDHARLMRARSFERARSFTRRTDAPAPQPAPPPPHVGPSSFSRGEEIRIRSNGGIWYEGVIQGISHGRYTVRYTDGSRFVTEGGVAASRLRTRVHCARVIHDAAAVRVEMHAIDNETADPACGCFTSSSPDRQSPETL